MVKRKQYTYNDVIAKYQLHCHQNGLVEKDIADVQYNEEENIMGLFNDKQQLIWAFQPEIQLENNEVVTVGNISNVTRSK